VLRRSLALASLVCAVAAAPAAAASSGGAVYAPVAARGFAVTPGAATAGAPLRFTFRALAAGARVSARVDFVAGGRTVARARLGRVRTGRVLRVRWTPPAGALPAGRYSARLVLGTRSVARAPLAVAAAAPPVAPAMGSSFAAAPVSGAAGVFPVQGPYTFGDGFGIGRPGHVHQGQDIVAASGTLVVAPLAGTVLTTAFQAGGAGYYVVLHGAISGIDSVYMHLQRPSWAPVGNNVYAGQQIGRVGATGDATGCHLHFEQWTPPGWYSGGAPFDPLPELLYWDSYS
jgi:murein DD-endopeptidase MepM/ murein hydrolase activator NlpD